MEVAQVGGERVQIDICELGTGLLPDGPALDPAVTTTLVAEADNVGASDRVQMTRDRPSDAAISVHHDTTIELLEAVLGEQLRQLSIELSVRTRVINIDEAQVAGQARAPENPLEVVRLDLAGGEIKIKAGIGLVLARFPVQPSQKVI